MKISLIAIGKTSEAWLQEAMDQYIRRLPHYTPFSYIETEDVRTKVRKPEPETIMQEEAAKVLRILKPTDRVILFDEFGKEFRSTEFANYIEKMQLSGLKHLVFIIGGSHGFHGSLRDRADGKVALSKLTFPHRLVRIIALEQLYRAHSLLRNEPYHHS